MAKNNITHNTNQRLTILIFTGLLLIVVLVSFLIINNKQIQLAPSLGQLPLPQPTSIISQNITKDNQINKIVIPQTITIFPSISPTISNTKQSLESVSNTAPSTQSSNINYTQVFVQCAVGVNKMCVIGPGDSFYSSLGKDPYTGKLLVNGSLVNPDTIQFNITQETYLDEPITDASGKTLLSTKKEFNSSTNTLSLYIGVNATYQQNLNPDQLRRLGIEQMVRSFFVMFGESPDNFVKIEQIIRNLNSWQPSQ